MLLGETGTGKEVIARKIHASSPRWNRPLVTVNCSALPAALVESELFGYEKGAFTGAVKRMLGRFELADGGTILLDEVGELPAEVQPKLLRALQSGDLHRLGSPGTSRVDVCTTGSASSRSPCRRSASAPRTSLGSGGTSSPGKQPQLGKTIKEVPESLMRALTSYSWPGITQGSVLARDGLGLGGPLATHAVGSTLREVERSHILAVLTACGWRLAGKGNAAERLGLNRTTLQFRMKKLGISRSSTA